MKQTKYLFGSIILVSALGALVVTSMKSSTLRAVPVNEVRIADGTEKSFVGQRLRMVGHVAHQKVRRSTSPSSVGNVDVAHFAVEEKGHFVQVTYRDALPDTFRAGGPVQVDGVYTAPGVIQADHVLTKCPSKYDEIKSDPKNKAKSNYKTETKSKGKPALPVQSAQNTSRSRPVLAG